VAGSDREKGAKVLYSDLIQKLTSFMPGHEDAERGLATTLETLGFLLPERLVRALEAALPAECSDPLALGLSASRLQLRTHGAVGGGTLPRQVMERIQMICTALEPVLPPDLVPDLLRELPPPFQAAFGRHPTPSPPLRAPRGTLASGRPGSGRPLSEAAPGSTHPLHSARPAAAHQESVQSSNPHGDTKLSSAHGTTQEREHETLAEGRSERTRSG